ncbi:MAG: preprotein translocase subunit YajC [Spirochaetales bacterium]|nr:preprotein translocase subunit YajC [Spirochaetales bacterium]
MNPLFSALTFLQAQSTGADMYMTPIVFGLVIVIFYFLIIRPQNKKQKDLQNMLKAIKKGDKVVTIGGLRGVVERVDEDTVTLKVDEGSGTSLEFNKSAIANLVNPPVAKDDKKLSKKASKEIDAPVQEKP